MAYWLPRALLCVFVLLILVCVGINDYLDIRRKNSRLEKKCQRKDLELEKYENLFKVVEKW